MSVDYTLPFAVGLLSAGAGAFVVAGIALRRVCFWILRRPARRLRGIRLVALALAGAGVAMAWSALHFKGATAEHAATDLAMIQAPRPPRDWRATVTAPPPYRILAGDLHCHINPPDWDSHVARHLPETIALAKEEGLEFVSLIPHVFSGFYGNPAERVRVTRLLNELRERVNARPADDLLLDVGIEYVDPGGHVGMVLGDVAAALDDTRPDEARRDPGLFFDAFTARGGVLVVHHPLLNSIPTPIPITRLDISWRPFTGKPPFRPAIAAVDARAENFEVANLFVRAVRDRLLLGDADDSTRRMMGLLDQQILIRKRRLTPVGGTDSHSFHLRPMTFVLAEERSLAGVRDAIRAGRTCVVSPSACTLEVRRAGDAVFAPVGSAIEGARRIEARAGGKGIAIYRNGERVAAPAGGEIVSIEVPEKACSIVRAAVDGGYSAPVYVNCPFAAKAR